jgi:hypothetical protein
MRITYYVPCGNSEFDILINGFPFRRVTELCGDKRLIDCYKLAFLVRGYAWRVTNHKGVQYGIWEPKNDMAISVH